MFKVRNLGTGSCIGTMLIYCQYILYGVDLAYRDLVHILYEGTGMVR